MKKLTLVLVALAFVAGMAVAEDVTLSVSGSADVEWGFAGQLIDNTGSFLGESVASGDFYSSDDAGDLVTMDIPAFTFTMSVEDADGNVIVEAAAQEIEIGGSSEYVLLDDTDDSEMPYHIVADNAWGWAEEYESVLDYIKFPNVIPGMLGITLSGDDALEPGYAPSGSASENERILIDVTPIPQLEATVGLLIKPDNKLYTNFYDVAAGVGSVQDDGLFTWPDDGDIADDGLDDNDFDDFEDDVDLEAIYDDDDVIMGWEAATYLSWAASLELTFTQELGEEDEISVGFGTVIDSAFTNWSYEPDFKVDGTDNQYSVFTEGAVMNEAESEAVITEVYGAQVVNPLTIKDMMPGQFDSTDEAKMLRTNEVRGRATIPLGLGVEAAVGDLTAAVDFQTVLAEGKDTSNMTGIRDFVDLDKSTHDYAAYAMPMYAAVDVGYALAVGDMTITPGVNFKYCSDFWKWGWDGDDEEFQYTGDVSGADFLGRPMSLDVGLDVEGIAGMIDIGISAGLSLGDGDAGSHAGLPEYTITADDSGVTETYVYDNTLAELIDFWLIQPTKANEAKDYPNDAAATLGLGGYDVDYVPDTTSDGQNNGFFASTNSAMDIELSISAEPIDGLTIENTTTYAIDNAGIGGADDDVLFGSQLSSLANETGIEYDWMVGDAVAFTIFGSFTYESVNYVTEAGQKYIGLRSDTADVMPDVFEFGYSEAPSMATFDYALGVKCSVGL